VDKFKKLLEEFSLKADIINTLMGIALIVSLILIFLNPNNQYAILIACISGGLMNIQNGLKLMKDPKKKTTGMSFLLLGAIVIILGFIIITML
jgi:uncharacterized membrane protein HdeD (DUF308 family)